VIAVIIRKKVSKSGGRGVVFLPSHCIGEEVVIVTEEDILRLEDLMFEILAFKKNRELDDTEALRKVKMLESRLNAAIEELNLRIDKLASLVNQQICSSKGNPNRSEQDTDTLQKQSCINQGN